MKRVFLLAAVAALLVAAVAVPAFAAPGDPGPNAAAAKPILENSGYGERGEVNYGHCQSEYAKAPGDANTAAFNGPAIYQGPNEGGAYILCGKGLVPGTE